MQLSFAPTLCLDEVEKRRARLLTSGPILDPGLAGRIRRIDADFARFARCYPLAPWAPGLAITPEMRSLTEALFPVAPLRRAFSLLVARSCRFTPLLNACALPTAASWLDLLLRLEPHFFAGRASTHGLTEERWGNPALALKELAHCEKRRQTFLFALFLPRHYGGGFDRYPRQYCWLKEWLNDNRKRLEGRIRALDCACGSGEGTYGLSELILESGFEGAASLVHGSTYEHLELFAAAHAFFPHEPGREAAFRQRVAPLFEPGAPQMEFYLDEVGKDNARGEYHLVLCNGLLGGPLLHEKKALYRAVAALAARLAPKGLLLAADRFHAGWHLKLGTEGLREALLQAGLTPVAVPEGVAGVRLP